MTAANMPAAELEVDVEHVRALLVEQHPDLAHLPISADGFGWDNVIFRLGPDLAVRLPRRASAVELIENEQRWLPSLAHGLPLPVPAPVRAGRPSEHFPWPWSICPWLHGEVAATHPPVDPNGAATTLGEFVRAFRRDAPADAPRNPFRGVGLAGRTELFERHLGQLAGLLPATTVTSMWREVLAVAPWSGPPQWLHGDLHPANVLVDATGLCGVIDFGDLTAGDPATDLFVAWMMFDASARRVFRTAAGAHDPDLWARGRGWALAIAIALLATTNDHPVLASVGERTLAAVLADGEG